MNKVIPFLAMLFISFLLAKTAIGQESFLFVALLSIFFLIIKNLFLKRENKINSEVNIILLCCILYFITRVVFFIWIVGLESRYLIQSIYLLECGIFIWIYKYINQYLYLKK